MKRLFSILPRLFLITLITTAIANCGGGSSGSSSPPPPGTLSGTVSDASTTPATAISGAALTVFNGATNSPVASLSTDTNGQYSVSLNAGTYYIKVVKQGYESVPPALLTPVPFNITSGQTTTNNVSMFPATNTYTGWITGKVNVGTTGKGGVLVVATDGSSAYSTLSNSDGSYAIYNVPVAAAYSVTGQIAGYTSTTASNVAVSQDTATADVNLDLTANAAGVVPVSFNVISQTGVTPPASMVVSLINPLTHETIPGLTQSLPYAPSINFQLSGVADGNYLVRASYANDTIVVDPDSIRKFGEPSVTVSSGSPSPNPVSISATSAVNLISPTNPMTSTDPAYVVHDLSLITPTAPTPTFSWDAYPSASDYVVEVMDAATGDIIWGGFSGSGDTMVKKVSTTSTSIVFNSDGQATSGLQDWHVYRWRIYASKNDTSTLGWHLISSSEEQRGLIYVVPVY